MYLLHRSAVVAVFLLAGSIFDSISAAELPPQIAETSPPPSSLNETTTIAATSETSSKSDIGSGLGSGVGPIDQLTSETTTKISEAPIEPESTPSPAATATTESLSSGSTPAAPILEESTTSATTVKTEEATPTLEQSTTAGTTIKTEEVTPTLEESTTSAATVKAEEATPTLEQSTTAASTIKTEDATPAAPTLEESTTSATTVKAEETTQEESTAPSATELVTETTPGEIPAAPPALKPKQVPSKPSTAPPTLAPIDFNCKNKADGYYADPKHKCSSKYYACVGGLGRLMHCGAGDLVYEPESGLCERRQDSFRCTGTRKTTQATTRRPPPPVKRFPINCAKKDDDWYADPQKKCSHVFYSCANGIASRFQCAGNMYFNVETKACEAFQDVIACSGKKRQTTTRKPTTTAGPTPKPPVNCAKLPAGQYADPAKKCSDVYYVCSAGIALKRSCPKGLYYDVKEQLCDYFEYVFACSGKTRPPVTIATTKAAVKPSPASLLSNEFDCSKQEDGTYLPPGKKCSDIFFKCVGYAAYKLRCQEGLYYDLENERCDRFQNIFDCSGKKPTSPKPTTPAQTLTTVKLPVDCSQLADGNYPDPEKKCSSTYYTCSNHLGTRRLCASGTFFTKRYNICDVFENVPACSGKPRPPAVSTKRPAPIPKLPFNCEKRADGNYEAGKCASHYYACVGGSTVRANCAVGTYYDSELDECGYKDQIPACGGVRPTTTLIATTQKS